LEFLRAGPRSLLWFVIATVGWGIFTLQDAVLTGMRQSLWVPIENTLFSLAKLILLIAFATSWTQLGIFASWTIPLAFAIVPISLLIFRRLMPQHVRATRAHAVPIEPAHIIRYIAGDYLGALFALMSTVLLPIIVTQEAGAAANAHFYQPWTITASLQLVAMNMATSLTVEAARDEQKLGIYARHALRSTARLILPAVVLIVLGAPYLLRIFGASYAAEGSMLLRLLVLSVIPNIVVSLYLGLARVRRRMRSIMMVQGLLCALGLSLSYTLLARYGIVGVGWAWLLTQTVVATVIITTQLRPLFSTSDHIPRG
jgi:O-antigen/teichoic acid export membrane protein